MNTHTHFLSHSILPRLRNVSNKSRTENQNTNFMFNNFFFLQNRPVYEIMWKNIVERVRPQMTIWRMRIACRTPNATNTHSEYVIIIAFPQKQWLDERVSMLVIRTSPVLLTLRRCVYCAVRTDSLNIVHVDLSL
jgi:hypothetical protein